MTLKQIGKTFNALTRNTKQMSRPLTGQEEQELIAALDSLVDVSDLTVTEGEYDSVEALRLDVSNGNFKTRKLSCPGIMTDETYTAYRMRHDILNHCLENKSFSPFDELLSGLSLLSSLEGKVSPYVLDFIFTDVVLMNSVYEFSPSKWQRLENGKHHSVCCFKTWNASQLLTLSNA